MKNLVYILCLALMLNSCIRENLNDGTDSGRIVEMKLRISTRANSSNESIKNVRIIVVNKYGDVKFNESKSVTEETTFKAQSRTGKNDFYVICNETATMTSALNGITKSNDLETLKIQYNSKNDGSSLVMYGEMKNVEVESTAGADDDPDGYTVSYTDDEGNQQTGTELPIAVKRLPVKLSLSFIKSTPDFTVSDISIKVVNLPKYSYLKEGKEYDNEMGAITVSKSKPGELMNDNKAEFVSESLEFKYENNDVIVFDDIYLPEYIIPSAHLEDKNYRTTIIVSGKCTTTDGQAIIGNWQIDLMRATNKLPRNNWYKIAATISGMGAIGLYANIEEVTQHDISVNWKPLDGLVIVSDLESDYDKNINIWNDYNVYFGVLKAYNATTIAYTDILFKYGSVIATRGSNPQIDNKTYTSEFNPTDDIIWKPRNYSPPIFSWVDLPYLEDGRDVPNNTGNISNGLGDPCKLVSLSAEQIERGVVDNELWHMATTEEYEQLIYANDNVTGDSRGYNTFHRLLIPNTHARNESGVLRDDTEGKGEYWSSKGGNAFEFMSDENTASVVSYTSTSLGKGYTVRCVRNTIPQSSMTVGDLAMYYTGGVGSLHIKSNLSYWTASLITKENAGGGEIGSDDNTLQFIGNTFGSKDGNITVNIDYTPKTRKYYIRVTGIGFDGKIHKEIATVTQYAANLSISATFNPALPKFIAGNGWETTVTCNILPNDPERVPIPSDKPRYLWVEVVQGTEYGDIIFDSRKNTENELGIPINPKTYEYNVDIKIPANNNIDARVVYILVKSTDFGWKTFGSIIQGNR